MKSEMMLAVLALLMSSAFLIGRLLDLYRGLASVRWPRTRGLVREARKDRGLSDVAGDEAALVVYDYEVAGRIYSSRRYDYAGRGTGRGIAAVLKRFEAGDSVHVWYDPKAPARAVLVPGITWLNYAWVGVGLAFLGLGLAWFVRLVRVEVT